MPVSSLMSWLTSTSSSAQTTVGPPSQPSIVAADASSAATFDVPQRQEQLPSPPPSSPLLLPRRDSPVPVDPLLQLAPLKRKRETSAPRGNDLTKNTTSEESITVPPRPRAQAASPPPPLSLLHSQQQDHLSTPHPSVTIHTITSDDIPPLKRLTAALLPIKYPDKFFAEILTSSTTATISRVAIYNDSSHPPITHFPDSNEPNVIGAIRCQLHLLPPTPTSLLLSKPPPSQLYIATLLLLSPYRGTGIATALLDAICAPEVMECYNVEAVYAHVWERNEDALGWYERRGFVREDEIVEGYYRRLRPAGAWVVRKDMRLREADMGGRVKTSE